MWIAAGRNIEDYDSATIADVLLTVDGYHLRISEEWQQTRMTNYMIYCALTPPKNRKSIYEWLPLDGDPSPEELKSEMDARKERLKAVAEIYEREGYINTKNG